MEENEGKSCLTVLFLVPIFAAYWWIGFFEYIFKFWSRYRKGGRGKKSIPALWQNEIEDEAYSLLSTKSLCIDPCIQSNW